MLLYVLLLIMFIHTQWMKMFMPDTDVMCMFVLQFRS